MNYELEIKKLNNLSPFVNFYLGDFSSTINKVVKEFVPFGKVAFITLEKTHLLYSKQVLSALLGVGSKLISLVMANPPKKTVGDFSKAFNLPEDVRAVITFDRELSAYCTYFCSVRNIPFIYVPQSCFVAESLENRLLIKNGNILDVVKCPTVKHVIVDFDLIEKTDEKSYCYAELMSKNASIIDYKLSLALTGKEISKQALLLLKESIERAFKIFSKKPAERDKELLVCGFMSEMAEVLCGGEISLTSATRILSDFLAENPKDYAGVKLFCMAKLLGLYSAVFGLKNPMQTLPNLPLRAEQVSSKTGLDLGYVAGQMMEQCKLLNKRLKKAIKTANSMSKTVDANLSLASGMQSTFIALGGNDKVFTSSLDNLKSNIKIAGDLPHVINGLTYLRLMGVTDLEIFD